MKPWIANPHTQGFYWRNRATKLTDFSHILCFYIVVVILGKTFFIFSRYFFFKNF